MNWQAMNNRESEDDSDSDRSLSYVETASDGGSIAKVETSGRKKMVKSNMGSGVAMVDNSDEMRELQKEIDSMRVTLSKEMDEKAELANQLDSCKFAMNKMRTCE